MHFEKGHLYHIYNQGNNRQRIFFKEENYLFFLKKIKTHVAPFADVLAWCLMPNHFHLMVRVNEVEMPAYAIIGGATQSRTPNNTTPNSNTTAKITNLNKEIGILLASYTRAIQKQENITGTLFRQKTKAECLTCNEGITPSFYNSRSGTIIPTENPEKEYPQVCFNYIHQNPVKAGFVKNAQEWEFSSCLDIMGFRNGTLINRELIKELELINKSECDFESHPD